MNNSFKKLFAGVSAVAIALTQVGTAFAAYSDVPSGVWFEDSVQAMVDAGYLDASQTRFRGSDSATRAEFVKLVVELNGGVLSTPPAVASFDDVKPGVWYYSYMEEAAKEGWVKGDKNCYGSHPCYGRPNANINRAEAAALINRAFGLEKTSDAPSFVDVPSGAWYAAEVQTAADHCVLQGDESTGRARPSDFMNRAEMVVMLHRVDQNLTYGVDCGMTTQPAQAAVKSVTAISATMVEVVFTVDLDSSEAVDASHYMVSGDGANTVVSVKKVSDDTVELTLQNGLSSGEENTLTVEDMMTAAGKSFSDTTDFVWLVTPRTDATLEVSLSSTNPTGDTVPKGAVGVVMESVDLTASCDGSVSVQDITVLHEGFGDEAEIDGVYASVDGARVSRRRTVDSQNQTAVLRFTKALVVPACKTVTIDILADFTTTATASAEHNFAIELPSDVQSNAKSVDGTFPLRGNTFRVAAVSSGVVTVEYRSVTPSQVTVGDKTRVLGRFEVRADSTEDQTVYSVTLEQKGTAKDGDVKNLKVRRSDGTVVSNTVEATTADFVTFLFDPPLTVLEGDRITLEVVGDIEGGAAETVKLQFEESSDLFAVGSLYGYGVNGQLYGSRVTISTTVAAGTVTIKAGQFTVEIDGPVQQKYTTDQNGANLANVTMTPAGDPINVRNLFVAVFGKTSTGAGLDISSLTTDDNISEVLENVVLRNTRSGQSISGVRVTEATGTSATSTFAIYRFDDFDVDQKDTWNLKVDFIENTTAGAHPKDGDKFYISICTNPVTPTTGSAVACGGAFSSTDYNLRAEGRSTSDDVGDVRPGGIVTGNEHRISTPTLTVGVVANGTTETTVRNSKNISLFRFAARAGEAEDVLFTKAIFLRASGSLLNAQNYALWVDSDGNGVVDTILEKGVSVQGTADATRTVSFNELAGGGYVIPAETTVTFEVHGDIVTNLTSNDLQLMFDVTNTPNGYLEAEQVKNGSNLSNISTNGTCSTTPCEIIVTTVTAKNWVLANQGDLFVSTNDSPRARQLLGGEMGGEVFSLKFRAQNEDVDVRHIQISTSGSLATSVSRLALYKASSPATPFAYAEAESCGTADTFTKGSVTTRTFCAAMGNGQLVVKVVGGGEIVLVRPDMKTEPGASTNDVVQLFLSKSLAGGVYAADDATGSGAIRAVGRQSSQTLLGNNADSEATGEIFIGSDAVSATNSDIIAAKGITVLAKIASIVNAGPVESTVITGTQPISQFKFTAATNNNSLNGLHIATLSGIIFNVSATNVILSNASSPFKIYRTDANADQNKKVDCTALSTAGTAISTTSTSGSGSFLVECRNLKGNAAGLDVLMESGTSATFALEGVITSNSSNATLQVTLQSFTNMNTSTFGATVSHIAWLDEPNTTQAEFNWVESGVTTVNSTSWRSN